MNVNRITKFCALSTTLLACNFETSDANSSECVDIPGVEVCKDDEGETGTGGGETDGETGGGIEQVSPGACIHNTDEELVGVRYQCVGELHASFDFDGPANNNCNSLLGDFCSETHFFGPPEDTYESPAVMACCGEYEANLGYMDEYLKFCALDIIDQVCLSIAKRIEKAVEDGSFGAYGGQASKLQQFIAQNQALCFQELLANDSNPADNEITSFFSVPNDPDWSSLENMVIKIDNGTIAENLALPADPNDWLECNGANDNDDEVFEGAPAPSGGTIYGVELAHAVNGALSGPSMFGSDITASATFDPRCAAKGCSNAEFWTDPNNTEVLGVEEIELLTDAFSVNNESGPLMTVESAKIVLYDRAEAPAIYDGWGTLIGYEIVPGGAYFLLVGAAANEYDHYLASNSSPITITPFEGLWLMSSFDINYVDQSGSLWQVEIGASDWFEPSLLLQTPST